MTHGMPLSALVRQGRGTVRLVGVDESAPLSLTVMFRDGATDHLPYRGTPPQAPDEIALPSVVARALGLRRGDQLTALGPTDTAQALTLVGTFERPGADDSDFWYGSQSPFPPADQRAPGELGAAGTLPPALMGRDGYVATMPRLGVTTEYVWDAYVRAQGLTFDAASRLPGSIATAGQTLRQEDSAVRLAPCRDGTSDADGARPPAHREPARADLPGGLPGGRGHARGARRRRIARALPTIVRARRAPEPRLLGRKADRRPGRAGGALCHCRLPGRPGVRHGPGRARVAFERPIAARCVCSRSGSTRKLSLVGAIGPRWAPPRCCCCRSPTCGGRSWRSGGCSRARIVHCSPDPGRGVRVAARDVRVHPDAQQRGPALVRTRLARPARAARADAADLRRCRSSPSGSCSCLRRLDRQVARIATALPAYLATRRLGRSPGTSFATSLLLVLAVGLLVVSTSYRAVVLRNHEDSAHQQVGADWNIAVAAPDEPLPAVRHGAAGHRRGHAHRAQVRDPRAVLAHAESRSAIDPARSPPADGGVRTTRETPLETWLKDIEVPDPAVPVIGRVVSATVRARPARPPRVSTPGHLRDRRRSRTDGHGRDDRAGDADVRGEPRRRRRDPVASRSWRRAPPRSPDSFALELRDVTAGDPIEFGTWAPLQWRGSDGEVTAGDGDLEVAIDPDAGHVVGGIAPRPSRSRR